MFSDISSVHWMRALSALRKCVSKSSETLTETGNAWPEKTTDCVTDRLVCSCPRFTRRPQQGGLGSHEAGQRRRGGVDEPFQRDVEVCCQPGCSWRRWRYSENKQWMSSMKTWKPLAFLIVAVNYERYESDSLEPLCGLSLGHSK